MHLWYASYGSNLSRDRFLCYLRGGRPEGARRTYPGARDRTLPVADTPFVLPGSVFFGGHSPTWGGGIAFYDAGSTDDVALSRAYLITEGQFADVAAQEMRRDPGEDLDLTTVLDERSHTLGEGHYEALHLVGELDGRPVITFTSPEPAEVEPAAPSAAYLAMIARGLQETHEQTDAEVVDYLLSRPGVAPAWSRGEVAGLVTTADAA
jgi:hypothetical protein